MFEISWSELLILAVVTLLFVGPKDLPVFLRTIGKYAGAARRQAAEFRAHFDQAMREAEFAQMKEELSKMETSVNAEVMGAKKSFDDASSAAKFDPSSITTPKTAFAAEHVPMAGTAIVAQAEAAVIEAPAPVTMPEPALLEPALPAADAVPMPARPGA